MTSGLKFHNPACYMLSERWRQSTWLKGTAIQTNRDRDTSIDTASKWLARYGVLPSGATGRCLYAERLSAVHYLQVSSACIAGFSCPTVPQHFCTPAVVVARCAHDDIERTEKPRNPRTSPDAYTCRSSTKMTFVNGGPHCKLIRRPNAWLRTKRIVQTWKQHTNRINSVKSRKFASFTFVKTDPDNRVVTVGTSWDRWTR